MMNYPAPGPVQRQIMRDDAVAIAQAAAMVDGWKMAVSASNDKDYGHVAVMLEEFADALWALSTPEGE